MPASQSLDQLAMYRSLLIFKAGNLDMVIGHRRRRSNWRWILRRTHYAAVHREYVVGDVDRTSVASDHVLVHLEASDAHQNPNHQERRREPGANHQGPSEDLQGQDRPGARLVEVHDTPCAGLPLRVFHQSGPGNDITRYNIQLMNRNICLPF